MLDQFKFFILIEYYFELLTAWKIMKYDKLRISHKIRYHSGWRSKEYWSDENPKMMEETCLILFLSKSF